MTQNTGTSFREVQEEDKDIEGDGKEDKGKANIRERQEEKGEEVREEEGVKKTVRRNELMSKERERGEE